MAAKRKRSGLSAESGRNPDSLEVEYVLGYKLVKSELRFFIKWDGYDMSFNTWQSAESLVHFIVFKQFVNEKFKSLEKDIYINISNIKEKLKDKIQAGIRQEKIITMSEIEPFDPYEYKLAQVFYHLLPPDSEFTANLENMVYKNYFFILDEEQRKTHDELLSRILRKEDIEVTIENDVDFDMAPKFRYITKNILINEVNGIDRHAITGCMCKHCSRHSECCPKLKSSPFAYKPNKNRQPILRISTNEKIIECGDLCECGIDCLNRVSQRKKQIPLGLFKTLNRGFGLRAESNIPKRAFILEYVGEMIGQAEANARAVTDYLFDLNYDKRTDKRFYTIDAYKYGNLSRFVNHSCKPNVRVMFVNNCHDDPKNQKLCFFSNRFIKKGEELTIDYSGGANPGFTEKECLCGAATCRGYIF